MRKTISILLLYLSHTISYSQDLSGKWTGNFESANAIATSLSKVEVEITLQSDSK